MYPIVLTAEERDMIVTGLNMRRNYIETSDPCICAADAKRMGRNKEINVLSTNQMEIIIKTEKLINRLFS